jgi:hypothetical protein
MYTSVCTTNAMTSNVAGASDLLETFNAEKTDKGVAVVARLGFMHSTWIANTCKRYSEDDTLDTTSVIQLFERELADMLCCVCLDSVLDRAPGDIIMLSCCNCVVCLDCLNSWSCEQQSKQNRVVGCMVCKSPLPFLAYCRAEQALQTVPQPQSTSTTRREVQVFCNNHAVHVNRFVLWFILCCVALWMAIQILVKSSD